MYLCILHITINYSINMKLTSEIKIVQKQNSTQRSTNQEIGPKDTSMVGSWYSPNPPYPGIPATLKVNGSNEY